jgi:hypothetical protein
VRHPITNPLAELLKGLGILTENLLDAAKEIDRKLNEKYSFYCG